MITRPTILMRGMERAASVSLILVVAISEEAISRDMCTAEALLLALSLMPRI